ncbi:T9SS type A sorting domain-containing protein [Flavobacterium taihuense]|uniref:T9SS type A sorting domain-containing protein n=1 Tax=Flavobacterium taihuense TaxID=2857508 RepID=A0ABS6XQF5_9FLAO|nr:T9SS type A sorting domain-containing protein [Flavobacterium taihuense]MBW4358907.1 T9SS type A sorting domain-containing protein [Flavobacterium taihuense]
MKKTLLFILFPLLSIGQAQIGTDIDGKDYKDYSGSSVSLSSDGSVLAIGAPNKVSYTHSISKVRVYKKISGVWTQLGADIDGDADGDESGSSVSLSSDGSVVAIGVFRNINYSHYVRIYKNVSGVWTQLGANIVGETNDDQSGSSVSLSSDGSIVAIGAPFNSGNGTSSGQVRVYKNVSGVWTQLGADIDGEAAYDESGYSVSLSSDGSVVAIGAELNAENGFNSGQVRVYKNVSGVWTQIGADINGEAAGDHSGHGVALSSDGSVVAIGAFFNDENGIDSGQVRVYKNVSGVWTQIGADIDGEAAYDESGSSVSISSDGSVVAIGGPENDGNGLSSGQVRVYKNVSGVWTKLGADINGEAIGDRSGYSVALSSDGSMVAIGAPYNDENGLSSGQVRVYDLSVVLSSDSFVMANFAVYPNPASEVVKINLQEDLMLEKVNIYNTLGQLVKTEKNNTISVSYLSKGSYFFEVITDKGKATKTILVQ